MRCILLTSLHCYSRECRSKLFDWGYSKTNGWREDVTRVTGNRELGIPENVLYAWVSKFKKADEPVSNDLKVLQAEMASNHSLSGSSPK